MNQTRWILLDTETNGLSAPIYVVELAAQRMRGWEPEGEPFRRLLNQNVDIPPEASRVNGYTREILERDGEPAPEVYRDFARYADGLPLVSYNLKYDLDSVLLPEWARLGLSPIGTRGFCALELARRLLDPVPAGNCKLQTLRQFYRLPEHGAHTGAGDVQTVVDLLAQVLHPLATQRDLHTWDELKAFTEEAWFPQRIAFGKFKGRDFRDARTDDALLQWLQWLSASSSARSSAMGRWYLGQIAMQPHENPDLNVAACDEAQPILSSETSVVLFVHPELGNLRQWIAEARTRLADLEAEYTGARMAVEANQAELFALLRVHYQERDRKKLMLNYREKYLEALMFEGRDEAIEVAQEHRKAQAQVDEEYEQAAAEAENRHELTEEEAIELKAIYRKLVRLFHPDRFAQDDARQEVYVQLTQEINRARDEGDIERLREISRDPDGFMQQHYGRSLDFSDGMELLQMRRLYESLQHRTMSALDMLDELRISPEYELQQQCHDNPEFLQVIAEDYIQTLQAEIEELNARLESVGREIAELVRIG